MTAIECSLAQILITESSAAPQVIVLREVDGERCLPIHIGFYEAMAINRHVHGEEMIRPMTHDLLANIIEQLGGALQRVVVNDLVADDEGGGTFYGMLVIEREGAQIEIDCRPSDAIALAVRTDCRIFVAEHVLSAAAAGQ